MSEPTSTKTSCVHTPPRPRRRPRPGIHTLRSAYTVFLRLSSLCSVTHAHLHSPALTPAHTLCRLATVSATSSHVTPRVRQYTTSGPSAALGVDAEEARSGTAAGAGLRGQGQGGTQGPGTRGLLRV